MTPEIDDRDLPPLQALVDLETFRLNGGPPALTSPGLARLASARNLRTFRIEMATNVDRLDWLAGTRTEELFLCGTGIGEEGLGRLPLSQLRHLELDYTKVTDAGVQLLGQCKKLEWLRLDHLPVTDKGLEVLDGLPQLQALFVNGTQITDKGVKCIANLRGLMCLGLSGTQTSNAGLGQLGTLTELRELQLNPRFVDASGLHHLGALQKLDFLALGDFGGKSRIDDTAVTEIAKFKGLKHLYLDGAKISDDGLARIGTELTNLEVLSLYETNVTDQAGAEFQKAHPRVRLQYGPWGSPQ